MNKEFGRLYSVDERDQNYLISALSAVAEPEITRTYRYWWADGHWGDQGATPQCVAYAWLHFMEDGPVTWEPRSPGSGFIFEPEDLYSQAQQVDEWPGEGYAGTSVRAGAKIMRQWGIISEYRWAWDLQGLIDAVLHAGPVVVGTNWYERMMNPNADGYIVPKGALLGGHAYVINGVNLNRRIFRLKNSWGREWGDSGHALLRYKHMEKLINEQGEVCLAVEAQT